MSELKVILATPHPKMKDACDGAVEVYLKYEADAVIAELKGDYKEACDRLRLTANLIKDEQLAATRHQKYKRCLAMARCCGVLVCFPPAPGWCESEAYIHEYGSEYDENLVAWFGKWYERWLKIAEKFKEAK